MWKIKHFIDILKKSILFCRKYDYENFICTILLQNTSRSCAFAVRSFNVEVARVAEQVSQETIGAMRLKFWEEAIEKCFSGDIRTVPKHPVAVELYKVHTKSITNKISFFSQKL